MESTKESVRDCNTCAHHGQAKTLDDCPARCWDCTRCKSLPLWEPIEDGEQPLTALEYAALHQPEPSFASIAAQQEALGTSALSTQVSGSHYKGMKIQPIEYIHANSIPFPEGNVIKYVSRWRNKNGIKDLEKAKHVLELLIELESKGADGSA